MQTAGELRKPDVAARLKISVATLDRWIRDGKAPASFLIGRERRFDTEEVDRWLAEQRRATA